MLQLPRCIVYLHYFCCIASRLICCSSCDNKEAKGKVEKRGRSTRRSQFQRIAKYAISCLFPCPICKTSNDGAQSVRDSYLYNFLGRVKHEWKVTNRKRLFSWRLLHTSNIVFHNVPPPLVIFWTSCCDILAAALRLANLTSWLHTKEFSYRPRIVADILLGVG